MGIQLSLLLGMVLVFVRGPDGQWLWLPVVWSLTIIFVCGLALSFSAFNVYVRDMQYRGIHERGPVLAVRFLFVQHHSAQIRGTLPVYPVADLVLVLRNILLDAPAGRFNDST